MDTCRKIGIMLSEGMDRDLTPWERVRIRMHLIMCEACTQFGRQLRILRQASRALVDRPLPQRVSGGREPE
jgi:predicted anti-sigma-YlaC factor YlaD